MISRSMTARGPLIDGQLDRENRLKSAFDFNEL
jgi:hypothetical protein